MMDLVILPLLLITLLALAFFVANKKTGKPINWRLLGIYTLFLALGGPIGEIVVGTIYHAIFGFPLWQYQILPTHQAYTSYYAPIIWGLSGAFLYLVEEMLGYGKKHRTPIRALILMTHTIIGEIFINVLFLVLSGSLIFYYSPGDLLHVSSLQTLPFYFLLGLVILKSIKRFKKDWLYFILMFTGLLVVIVFLTD